MKPLTQAIVIRELRIALERLSLSHIRIASSDENSHRRARQTWEVLQREDAEAVEAVGLVCVHSYEGLQPARDNAARVALRKALRDRELWVTEYGDGEGSGLDLAITILHDLHYLRCTSWCYWQPIEPFSGWGLLNTEYGEDAHGSPTWVYTKYWVFATFTRALRPGMLILSSNSIDTVFAFDPRTSQLVILVVNCGVAQNAEFDLQAFSAIDDKYSLTYTAFDGSALLKDLGRHPTQASSLRISLCLPAECVVALSCNASGFPPCPLDVPVYIEAWCGKVAHVHGEEDADGAKVTLWERCTGQHFRWRLERQGASFRIVSCHSGRAWCNPGGHCNGTGIVTREARAADVGTEVYFEPAEEGYWYIIFATSRKSAHLLGEDRTQGAVIATWMKESRRHHWWRFVLADV